MGFEQPDLGALLLGLAKSVYYIFQRPLMALLLAMLVAEDDKDEDEHGVSLTSFINPLNVFF